MGQPDICSTIRSPCQKVLSIAILKVLFPGRLQLLLSTPVKITFHATASFRVNGLSSRSRLISHHLLSTDKHEWCSGRAWFFFCGQFQPSRAFKLDSLFSDS